MLEVTTTAQAVVFSLSDIVQFVIVAFSIGGLYANVRQNTKDIGAVRDRYEKLEERFLVAVEDLGISISSLTTELKTVLAVHETRLNNIEKDK